MISLGKNHRSCDRVGGYLGPLILVSGPRGMSDRSIWVYRAHTHEAGAAHSGDYVFQPGARYNFARFESSYTVTHISGLANR
ncbi:hypothetical protein HanXRQr2_Chr16g0734141 [Helianthus annuus]|uniref:Uncharacterized protein n=1 Tax=Helianthus annuus TaxID=4232 RepID=A0A9K3GXN9_HELAN|nr:hypothetical protein HanXRQr2_Chr16g0734141 [Helianthus annuus]KAJ0820134.1 hypothetical protein HanPSC8_Chr16g0704241 [Helianthus annuus]